MVKQNWPEDCSRSEDNVCSSVTKASDNKEFSSEHLSFLREKHPNRVIIGHININSIRNKFYYLIAITKGNVDVLMISETKLDESFPSMQLNIDGYNYFRSDRNAKGGGILMYDVWDDISCKLIPMRNSSIEGLFIELKLRKKKWLLRCSYNSHRRFISNHLIDIGKNLDLLSTNYDNIFLLGDFNAEIENNFLKEFCDLHGMKSLVRIPTCYKNPANPTCIDLMLTNSNRSFVNSCTNETGLSDFHKMIVTVLKIYFQKREAKVINYRDYRNFSNEEFRQQVLKDILKATQNGDIVSYESFLSICQRALDSRAPKK